MMAKLHVSRPVQRGLWVLLAVLALIAVCEAAGWPFLKGPLQSQLQEQLEREVDLGEGFRLRLIGPVRLQSDRFVIGPPAWAEGELRRPLIGAEGIRLELPWSTLLGLREPGGELRIRALEVDRLAALLHRRENGQANWQFGDEAKQDEESGSSHPRFDRLVVSNGRIEVIDRPLALQLQAQVRTEEGKRAEQENAGLRLEARGRWKDEPLVVQLSSTGALPLLAPQDASASVPVRLQARFDGSRLSFDGKVVDVLRLAGMQGKMEVAGSSLATTGRVFGVVLPRTGPFEAQGHIAREGQRWQVDFERARVGHSRLAGHFTYDRAPEPPRLEGELRGQRLRLADLAPAFGARRTPEAPPAAPPGRVLPAQEFDIPALGAMNAEVQVRLQEVQLGKFFAEPLQPLQATLRLQDKVLKIDRLLARASGGELQGALTLDARQPAPRWAADLKWGGIRLERWLSPRNRFAAESQQGGEPQPFIAGVLGGQARLKGHGRSTAALLGSLDGSASAWVQDGRISHLLLEALGLDIAQGLGLVVRGDSTLPLHCAAVQLQARDGVLQPEVAVLDTPDTTVLVSGSVSLRQETLGLKLTARPKDVSPMTLRSPLYLEGRFAEPAVRPDMGAIGGRVLAAAALALVNPLAALLPLIDPGNSDEGGCHKAVQRLNGRDRSLDAAGHAAPPSPASAARERGSSSNR